MLNIVVDVEFKYDIYVVWLLINPKNVFDVEFKWLIDYIELVDKLFKLLNIVVGAVFKYVNCVFLKPQKGCWCCIYIFNW